jgi:hypothetical protein
MSTRYKLSAPIRSGRECGPFDRIDAAVKGIAASLNASEMQYPVLIHRAVLDHAEYPEAFPHLLMSASHRYGHHGDTPACNNARTDHALTEWCLSPAVCYHTYAQLAGSTMDRLAVFTARGRCFRLESDTAAGIRQIEFEMREIVFVGSRAAVEVSVENAQQLLEALARDLGLRGEWHVAEDPFFLPQAAGKALMQRLMQTKLEYQSLDASRLALASVNRHGSFFGQRFDITSADGEPVHTACLAVGLDRWWRHAHLPEESRREHACAQMARAARRSR